MAALEVRGPIDRSRPALADELARVVGAAADRSSASEELRAAAHDGPARAHLSPLRANLLRPLRLPPGARVLEVGAGSGALTRWLGEQGHRVVALEGSLAMAEVAAERCADLDGVAVLAGGIGDVRPDDGPFDVVVVGAVGDPAAVGAGSDADLLAWCAARLAPGGSVVSAVENQLSLAALAGAPEPRSGRGGVGVEGYLGGGPRGYSRRGLEQLLDGAGLAERAWLHPFPDHVLPTTVLADGALSPSELATATATGLARGVAGGPHPGWAPPYDLRLAHAEAVAAGLGPEVSSSFLVVARPQAGGPGDPLVDGSVLAWLSSDDRRPRWARHRRLERTADGLALVTEGGAIDRAEGWLTQRSPARQAFVAGTDLAQLAFEACVRGDEAALDGVLARWAAALDEARTATAGPEHPFRRPGSTTWLAPDHLDVDLGNFVVGADGGLTYVDDEWGAAGAVERDLVAVRALWDLARAFVHRGVAPGGSPSDTVDELAVGLARRAGLDVGPGDVAAWKDAERALQALAVGSPPDLVEGWLDGSWTVLTARPGGVPLDRLRDAAATAEAEAAEARARAEASELALEQARAAPTTPTTPGPPTPQGGRAHLRAAGRALGARLAGVRPRAPEGGGDAATDALVADLQAQIRATLARHLDPDAPVGFVNFPNHRNAGDSALWLAGEALLGELTGGVRYRCTSRTFDRARFERATGGGPIVINAGGNFGDLYPRGQQRLREEVLATFKGRPVVQLPQSIHFQDPANLDRVRRLVAEHGRTTILCRDEASLELARSFDAEVGYCPDLAFAHAPLRRAQAPDVDILWLARTDPERRHPAPEGQPDVAVVDWLQPLPGEAPWPGRHRLDFQLNLRLVGTEGPVPHDGWLAAAVATATFGPLARAWVGRGVGILSRGRVVVTDRLHGHLLALLAGIPSVVLDNSYGKVHGVVALTSAASPLTHLAGSPEEALALARQLARPGG